MMAKNSEWRSGWAICKETWISQLGVFKKRKEKKEGEFPFGKSPYLFIGSNCRLLARRLERTAVHASLGAVVLVLHQAKTTTVFAAAGKALYLDLQARDAVALTFFFFSHR
jgi:hypothetical protein